LRRRTLRQHAGVTTRVHSGTHVLVTGIPGSGKSTLASALSEELDPPASREGRSSRHLVRKPRHDARERADRSKAGLAAVRIQRHLIETMPSMVVDCGLWTDLSEPELLATGRCFVQVYCSCPFEVARERVASRDRWDSGVAGDEFERFRPLLEPLRLPHPLIVVATNTVATNTNVDLAHVADEIRAVLGSGPAG